MTSNQKSEGHRKLARCFMSIGQQLLDSEDTTNQNGVCRVLRRPGADTDLFESPLPSFYSEQESEEQGLGDVTAISDSTERPVSLATNRPAASNSNNASAPKKRRLAPKYHTIRQILDEWRHPEDGVLKLNEKYGNTWRKHFTSSEKNRVLSSISNL